MHLRETAAWCKSGGWLFVLKPPFLVSNITLSPKNGLFLAYMRRFNKAVVQPAFSLGVREKLWSQPYGRQTMAGRKNLAVI